MGRIAALALASASTLLCAQVYGPPADKNVTAPAAVPSSVPPDLAAITARAIEANPDVRAARLNNRAAATDIRAAKWQQGPSVSVGLFGFEGGTQVVRNQNVTANVTVDQPIYQGGRISGEIDRARASERQSLAITDETAQDIALRVANAYYTYVGAVRRVGALDQGLTEHRSLVSSIERRVQQEVSPTVDLELGRSRTAQLLQQQIAAKAQADASLQQLRVLLADPSFTPNVPPSYDPAVYHPSEAGAVESATTCSPTRKRLQATAQVARADQKVARSQYLPHLSAQFSSNEVTGDRVGLSLTTALNGGLAPIEAERAAKARRLAAEMRVGSADVDVQTQLAADFAENAAARERVIAGRTAAEAARGVTDSYQRLFVVGRRSWLDVMNAALEVTQAELAVQDAEVSAMASAARIGLRTCRWQPQPQISR
ncbi:TolC family protein [Sphingomonas tabacisoli]|uniref:TolC family protein n=1 Tax=Sphingomonas tabacisoli TaxID=2249466 RepID=A0ABW4I603_9SPHN